jgi:type VI secretion system protein ImpG
MADRYYSEELDNLRRIAREFSKDNPAIAPMLGEPCTDPDVERLLEGVAFLTGAVRRKIDDEFPEIVHDLLRQVWPNALKPFPSSTIVAFSPGEKLTQKREIPKGSYVDTATGKPLCRFRTCSRVDVLPLAVMGAEYVEKAGKPPWIRVRFGLNGVDVTNFKPGKIRFHIGGGYKEASLLYLILGKHLREIRIGVDGDEDEGTRLDPAALVAFGFDRDDSIIPWPRQTFEGFRLIQEYFLMPERFLSYELTGFDGWNPKLGGTGFHVDFILDRAVGEGLKCDARSFVLHAAPVVNLFLQDTFPVIVDHRKTEYPVEPQGYENGVCQIYSIEKVSGFVGEGISEIKFSEFHGFRAGLGPFFYREKIIRHPVKDMVSASVSLAYAEGRPLPPVKSLSFDAVCTNGKTAEDLAEDESMKTHAGSPESILVKNIRKPTACTMPVLGSESLWKLTALLSMNILSLKSTEDFKSILGLFLIEGYRDRRTVRINEHKINGIHGFVSKNVDRLIGGALIRGIDLEITLSGSHFAGDGDVYLFGTVLSRFFGMYASINTFTRLTIRETDKGEVLEWRERMGRDGL